MSQYVSRNSRSWTRSKRISLGCLDWRSVDRGSKEPFPSHPNALQNTEIPKRHDSPDHHPMQVAVESRPRECLYRSSRKKPCSPADALLRRLRLRSLTKRRPQAEADPVTLKPESPYMMRSASAPRSITMSPITKPLDFLTNIDPSDSAICWQLRGSCQSALSLKSAPDGIVNEHFTNELYPPNDGRKSAEMAECINHPFQEFPMPLNKNYSSPEVWCVCSPNQHPQLGSIYPGQQELMKCLTQDVPPTNCLETNLWSGRSSRHSRSMHSLRLEESDRDIPTHYVPFTYSQSCTATRQHHGCNCVRQLSPDWTACEKVSALSMRTNQPLFGEKQLRLPELTSPQPIVATNPAANVGKSIPTNFQIQPICQGYEQPNNISNSCFWAQNNVSNTDKPSYGDMQMQTGEYRNNHNGLIRFNEMSSKRPDSLLSTSYTTVNSTNFDSMNTNSSSSSNDSALGGTTSFDQTLCAGVPSEDVRLDSRGCDALRSMRINAIQPPINAENSTNSCEEKNRPSFQLPPTPRRPVWGQPNKLSTPTSPQQVSQQARIERKKSSYVNASAYFPFPDKCTAKPKTGSVSPPPGWSQLLPYRVSTVPQNLSERLKKSETLPNDVWIQTRSQQLNQEEPRSHVTSVNLPNSTSGSNVLEGSKSPPPRPPMRTTSQRRFRPANPSIYVNENFTNLSIPAKSRVRIPPTYPVPDGNTCTDTTRQKLTNMQDTSDVNQVLCRYSQLYSLPKLSTASMQFNTPSSPSPAREIVLDTVSEIPSLYVERLNLRS